MLRNNRPQCLGRFRGLEATGSVTLALDQGPLDPGAIRALAASRVTWRWQPLPTEPSQLEPCPQDPGQQTPRVAAAGTAAG